MIVGIIREQEHVLTTKWIRPLPDCRVMQDRFLEANINSKEYIFAVIQFHAASSNCEDKKLHVQSK